jgi:hypothetical protein
MKQNQDPNTPDQSQNLFNGLNIELNGQQITNLNSLPPEIKQKIDAAFQTMGSNPNLMNLMKGIYDLSKTGLPSVQIQTKKFDLKNGQSVQEVLNNFMPGMSSDSGTISTNTNNEPHISQNSTSKLAFNKPAQGSVNAPNSQSDQLRNIIFILCLLGIATYLIAKFVFKMPL